MNNLLEVLEDLYRSEINFELSSFWDNCYRVRLGDEINGFKSDAKMLASLEDVARELIVAAVAYYPDSEFAKKYGMA